MHQRSSRLATVGAASSRSTIPAGRPLRSFGRPGPLVTGSTSGFSSESAVNMNASNLDAVAGGNPTRRSSAVHVIAPRGHAGFVEALRVPLAGRWKLAEMNFLF